MPAANSNKPWIVVVGGFLGAGKTTLLLAAAKELERRGLKSAVILNDQGEALVDTELTALNGIDHGEVTGGCFCCRFSDLVNVMDRLRNHAPAVIFAEPVGSCTDISATTLQPLREYSEAYRLAPFTVLVDPLRAADLLAPDADRDLNFLFRHQLQEADLVCFTKSDRKRVGLKQSVEHESLVDHLFAETTPVRHLSAKSGQGVAAWLDEVLSGGLSAGSKILKIDYEEYARAEAALAWLNLEVRIDLAEPLSSSVILGPLLQQIDADMTKYGIAIVHLKAILNSSQGYLKAAMTSNGQTPVLEGALDASAALTHDLLLNLRAVGEVAIVREIAEDAVGQLIGRLSGLRIHCFHPAPPQPDLRVSELIRHPS